MPPSAPTPHRHGLSRRQFIPRAAGTLAALGGAGAIGYELGRPGAPPPATHTPAPGPAAPVALPGACPPTGSPGSDLHHFASRPDLVAPRVQVNDLRRDAAPAASPRLIALTPMSSGTYPHRQRGPMLVDRRGRLVWFAPVDASVFDVSVQRYRGRPHLAWWQGETIDGHGKTGTVVLLDSRYRVAARVRSHPGFPLDIHELNITPQDTLLVTAYLEADADLRAVGGPRAGKVYAGHALEIDIATGRVLLDWSSLAHVPVTESYEPYVRRPEPYDYFHINSIALAADGNLLISGRHTWCVYKVERRTGAVIWRLGGKRSGFRIAPDAGFSWQHHVRARRDGSLTIFDNAEDSGHGSSGLWLNLDERARAATLRRRYPAPGGCSAVSMGSVQVLDDRRVFVGWGSQPYFSEFAADGAMLTNGFVGNSDHSYRTFAVDWVGHPGEPPAIVAQSYQQGGSIVFASWNGATQVDRWVVLAGATAGTLEPVGSLPWAGFETAICVNATGPQFVAVALDRDGRELGRSPVTALRPIPS